MSRNNNELVRRARRAGATVIMGRRSGHWKVYINGHFACTISGSPSDYHAHKNAERQLRRLGLNI